MSAPGGPHIPVIGLGADGWSGVPARLRTRIEAAEVVLGGRRHLDLLPDVPGQTREPWPSPLRDGLVALLERYDGQRVVAVASGDPLVSGVGSTLIEVLGADRVEVEPAVSSVALAGARMGWPAESYEVVSLVGRPPATALRGLAPGHRLLVLSSDGTTPATVAGLLVDAGYARSRLTVLSDLGTATEARATGQAQGWASDSPALNVIAVELVGSTIGGRSGGLPDDAFEHDGQLTKRDLRVSALARLAPQPGQLLWDVGAGAGSLGIEWMRAHPTCRAVAIEADEQRGERIGRNAARLGVPALAVVRGRAPKALEQLEPPDAIFVGGGATTDGLLHACLEALGPGGRLVVHGVTLETEALLARSHAQHGGELTRIQVETAAPLGSFTGWTPARAVTQWAHTR